MRTKKKNWKKQISVSGRILSCLGKIKTRGEQVWIPTEKDEIPNQNKNGSIPRELKLELEFVWTGFYL